MRKITYFLYSILVSLALLTVFPKSAQSQTMYVISQERITYWDPCFNFSMDWDGTQFVKNCISGGFTTGDGGAIYRVDLSNCTKVSISPSESGGVLAPLYEDIAVYSGTPGTIYGIVMNSLYSIDVATGVYTLINSATGAGGFNTLYGTSPVKTITSLVCDASGNLYAADGANNAGLYAYNIGTNTWSYIGNPGGHLANGDLTYYNGTLYMTTTADKLVSITFSPLTATEVSTLSVSPIFGANSVTTGGSCYSNVLLVASANQTIYSVNGATGVCTALCSNIIPLSDELFGAASIVESVNIQPVVVTASASNSSVCTGGSSTLSVSGALTYSWSPGGMTGASVNVSPGSTTTYTVTGTNASSCTGTTTVAVTVSGGPTAATTLGGNVSCFGGSNGSANSSGSGGAGGYSYLWSNASTSQNLTGLISGTYVVTVTDAGGCKSVSTVTVTQPASAVTASSSIGGNVNCFGASTGSVNSAGGGGVGSFTYLWSNASTSQNLTGLTSGTYVVTVRDGNNCPAVSTVTITQPASAVTASSSSTQTACTSNTGTAIATPGGGTGGYNYLWNNGQTTLTAINLAAGVYVVTITDANGCTATSNTSVSTAGGPTATATLGSNVSCFGASTGSANSSGTGGTGGYTYLWSNASGSQNITNVIAGTYFVTITDVNGCSSVSSANITQPASAVTATSNAAANVLCFGGTTGAANSSGGGGTAGYSYLWSNASTSQNLTGLASGPYVVTVTDANSCVAVSTVTITQPASSVSANATLGTNVNCFGSNTGSANSAGGGGVGSFTYLWNNASTSQNISGLTAGTYTVTVRDANNCTNVSTATVTQPAASLSATATATTAVLCNGGSTGIASATGSGGTTGYNYSWSTSASTQTISGLSATTYSVTITDANSCTSVSTITLTQPTIIDPATGSTAATCGSTNGTVYVTVSGGAPGYNYSWSTTASTQTVTGLASGAYTVTITDANGCKMTDIAVINNSGGATISSVTTNSVSCNGSANGSAVASASGGTGLLTYSWQPTGGGGLTATGLAAGAYIIVVTDANSCVSSSNVTIAGPTAIAISPTNTSATCGNSNGTINSNASGGTGTLSYLWSNSATTANITGLATGTYVVTVTDANGCTSTISSTINNSGGAVLTLSSQTNVNCNGANTGGAIVSVAGGAAPLTYTWSNSVSGLTNNNIGAGTYILTVNDNNNCATVTTVNITQPNALVPTTTATNNICGSSNGSASVNTTGGTGSYTYSWSNSVIGATITGLAAGSYIVTVTDNNLCTSTSVANIVNQSGATITAATPTNVLCNGNNTGAASVTVTGGTGTLTYSWSNSALTQTISGLIAATYTVTVNDQNNCSATSVVTITQPALITGTITATDASCGSSNGTAVASISGGIAGYTLIWSNAAVGNTAINLAAGGHSVTVTDANSCLQVLTAIVNNSGGATITTLNKTDILCNGNNTGSANITTTGGTGTLTYTWSPSGGSSATATNLPAATYTVVVTDVNGCLASSIVTITQPGLLTSTATGSAAGCSVSNGSATVTPNGGTTGYTYLWSDGQTTATANNIPGGSYSVTVTDANGCSSITTASVGNSGSATLLVSGAATICVGQSATINATATGGSSPYTYSWSNALSGTGPHTVSPTGNTTYTVNVTDANGCTSATMSINVNVNPALTLSVTGNNPICAGTTATLTAGVTGGSGVYTYIWLPSGASTPSIIVNPTGTSTYTVIVDDNCSAQQQQVLTVNVNQPPTVSAAADITSSCIIPMCVNFTGTSSGSCAVSSWTFSDGTTASTQNPNKCFAVPGSYNVSYTCTDANGCSATVLVNNMITAYGTPNADFSANPTTIIQNTVVDFTDLSTGANGLGWNFGDSASGANNTSTLLNPTHSFQDTGTYCITLLATGTGGCVDSTIQCLLVEEACSLPDSIPNVFSPNSDNSNDLFLIKTSGLKELICHMYNRWGMLLYEYNAIKTGWDGHTFTDLVAPDGTYYYILDATCIDGRKKEGHGFVQLVR